MKRVKKQKFLPSLFVINRSFIPKITAGLMVAILSLTVLSYAETTESAWDRALSAVMDGNDEQAVTLFRSVIAQNSRNAAGYANLAILLARTGNDREAETMFRRALSIENNHRINFAFAQFLLSKDRATEALPFALHGINDKKGNGAVLVGKIYRKLGQIQPARDAFEDALARNAHCDEAFDELIPLLLTSGEIEHAAELIRAALTDFPEPSALYWYGVVSEKNPSVAIAKRQYERYLTIYPRGKYRAMSIERLKVLDSLTDYEGRTDKKLQGYLNASDNPMGDRVLIPGRKWFYTVKWKFVTLGSMVVESVGKENVRGHPTWHIRYIVKSNPSIPLVDIDDEYESYVDPGFRYTLRFKKIYKTGKRYDKGLYDFNLEEGRFNARCVSDEGILYFVENDLPLDTYDGISVLTWARLVISKNRPGRAITAVDEDYKYSTILPGFTNEDLSANGRTYKTVKFNAQVNYVGIAGLAGKAIGWVSADAEALPVRALFEITIGSIDLRLQKIEGN